MTTSNHKKSVWVWILLPLFIILLLGKSCYFAQADAAYTNQKIENDFKTNMPQPLKGETREQYIARSTQLVFGHQPTTGQLIGDIAVGLFPFTAWTTSYMNLEQKYAVTVLDCVLVGILIFLIILRARKTDNSRS